MLSFWRHRVPANNAMLRFPVTCGGEIPEGEMALETVEYPLRKGVSPVIRTSNGG
jgi:hypothetical protein